MKLTKKLEAEILKLYHRYWDAYLKGDVKTFASYFDHTITIFGTAKGEVFANKKTAERFYKDTAQQMSGKAEMRKRKIALKVIGTAVLIYEQFDLYVLAEKEWVFYGHVRMTSLVEQKDGSWKVVLQHASFPDSRAEDGEQIATEKIKTENLQLREAVQRRTVELENKNRELEIETALEKVRTVAMGMKKADDMLSVCKTISQQLAKLGVKEIRNVQTAIFYESRGTYMNYEYYAKHDRTFITEVDFKNHKIQLAFAKKMMKGPNEEVLEQLKGKKMQDWYAYQKTTNQFADKYILKAHSLNYYWYSLGQVALGISTYFPLTKDETVLFKRFLKVFELAYRRYLDIEKAETQAREAQIELSLERVRAGAMAMRQSVELGKLIFVLYQELTKLDTKLDRCFIMIVNPENKGITWWMAGHEGLLAENGFFIPMNQHPSHLMYLDYCKKRKKKWTYLFEGKEKREWDRFGFSKTELAKLPGPIKKFMAAAKKVHLSGSSDQFGSLVTGSFEPLPEEQQEIISRFAIAFNQAYIRFLDLQKAETQTREAQIETALEKVRSRTMAMQNSNELQETAAVLFQEFKKLGAGDMQQFTIGIYNEVERVIDFRVTSWAGGGEQENRSFRLDMDEPTLVKPAVAAWKAGKKSAVFDLTGEALQGWLNYRNKISGITINSNDTGGRRVITAAYFSKGHLTISTLMPLAEETVKTLERFAAVFDGTYTRFLDLERAEAQALRAEKDLEAIKEAKQKAEEALTELQATQKQLIQAEKMASLGELTAGIAHEIQNPLNFVNNFSEVSKELLDEMKEAIEKGDTEDAKEIMNDVIQNLEKINHHGKRADGIVKGMLQHSRSSSNQKEHTDINALADEYLRLAYHGLRAKDKSFNATMKTDFDESIGNINIIPQDMGRVILNLITNAFYVVNEKKTLRQAQGDSYEPTVEVSTKKEKDKIEIKVKDNGNGIPQKILDKIFQPFFTTKPTGQGTGLGLSLSYDIVKAHGGEIKVNTKENEGTEFTISLPA